MSWATIGPSDKIRLRVKDREWCEIEINITRGILHIHGAVGDIVTRSELDMSDEIWMATTRRVFIVSGCGQCIDDLKRFFPECVPHLQWHMEKLTAVPPKTLRWIEAFFSEKHKAKIQQLRYNGMELIPHA